MSPADRDHGPETQGLAALTGRGFRTGHGGDEAGAGYHLPISVSNESPAESLRNLRACKHWQFWRRGSRDSVATPDSLALPIRLAGGLTRKEPRGDHGQPSCVQGPSVVIGMTWTPSGRRPA